MDTKERWKKALAVWEHSAKQVGLLESRIDPEQFTAVARIITGCEGKIVTTGTGTSGAAAKKIAHTFSCVERPALFLSPADAVHGGLGVVQREDVVFLFSKGGKTAELLSLLPSLETKGCTTVAVTEKADSILAERTTQLLQIWVDSEPDPFNMLATTSIAAVIATFDALAITVMEETGFTREQFGVIHPGGAVGERLLGNIT